MKHSAYGAYALLALIWGSNFIFVKWAVMVIPPTQVVLLRLVFGFLPVLVFALATRSMLWAHLRYAHHFLMMALLATTLYYVIFTKGTALLLSSVAGMLSGVIPLFTFLMAWLFLREEPLNARSVGGTVLGFIGVLLIARPWSSDLGQVNVEGVLDMIGGSLIFGCSFVYARKFISPLGISPFALTAYQIGVALLLMLVTTDTHGITQILADRRAWIGLVFGLGLCGTGIAYILYYFVVEELGAVAASGVTYVAPVVALLIGAFWVGEPVRPLDVLAMATILTGVGVLQSGRRVPKVELRPAE